MASIYGPVVCRGNGTRDGMTPFMELCVATPSAVTLGGIFS